MKGRMTTAGRGGGDSIAEEDYQYKGQDDYCRLPVEGRGQQRGGGGGRLTV